MKKYIPLYHYATVISDQSGWKKYIQRMSLLLRLFNERALAHKLLSKEAPESWRKTLEMRPDSLGIIIWPYICSAWTNEKRISVLISHHEIASMVDSRININVDQAITILDLNSIFPGMSIVMDRPKWFMREGELSLNLFLGAERIYSIAFSFANELERRVAYIGGIQGRNIPGALNLYHEITKAIYGCRPRDFLIYILFEVCRELSVERVYAVSEVCRHHRHPYFRNNHKSENSANYNDIWLERGGLPVGFDFYLFNLNDIERRDVVDVPAKKRAMYKKRYELLDSISALVRIAFQ